MIYLILATLIVVAAIVVCLFIEKPLRAPAALIAFILLVVLTGWNSIYQVAAGHVGLVYTFGAITDQTGEGLQLVRPWASVYQASAQVRSIAWRAEGKDKDYRLWAFSSESQDVIITATLNYRVNPDAIQNLYRTVGPDYPKILIYPRVQQTLKDETVKYSSVNVAPHREDIRKVVRDRLRRELEAQSIIVEDFLIDNIEFNQDFQRAIEKKQIATQDALAEEQRIVGEKHKANQAIEQARGRGESALIEALKQAEANRALNDSITDRFIQYQMVQRLAPAVQVLMLPTGAPFILSPDMLKKP